MPLQPQPQLGTPHRPYRQQSRPQTLLSLQLSGVLPVPPLVIADVGFHPRAVLRQQPQLDALQILLLRRVQSQIAGLGVPVDVRLVRLAAAVQRRHAVRRQAVQHAAGQGELLHPQPILPEPQLPGGIVDK